MGNEISTVVPNPSLTVEQIIADVPGYAYQQRLGEARFLKTVLARHAEGLALIKFFVKTSPERSLHNYVQSVYKEHQRLRSVPNVLPYARVLETEKIVYLIRQYLPSNLYDRISTRPFLISFEKIWVAFQLLRAVQAIHQEGICHGDIKTENVLVTSWNWVMIADLSGRFKPTVLPDDNPADYSFYFDTSLRRACYVAPERFSSAGEEGLNSEDFHAPLSYAMDIFSIGCVLAELFLEGHAIFTLSQLLQYKRNEYDPSVELKTIETEGMADMIIHMIQLDPKARWTADEYLTNYRGTVFPEYFYTFLHPYVQNLVDTDKLITGAMKGNILMVMKPLVSTNQGEGDGLPGSATKSPLAGSSNKEIITVSPGGRGLNEWDCKVEKIHYDLEGILRGMGLMNTSPSTPKIPGQNTGAVVFLTILCSCLRNLSYTTIQIRCLRMFIQLAPHVEDDIILDRLVPYVISLLQSRAAQVRSQALSTLTALVLLVQNISVAEANIFPEYIFPSIQELVRDRTALVRETYAKCLPRLGFAASRFIKQALQMAEKSENTDTSDETMISYETSLEEVQNHLQEQVLTLLVDSDAHVKRSLVSSILPLCELFGQTRTNEIIVKHITTYLNDRDWSLRSAYFDAIGPVGTFVGVRSLEHFILPLVMQALRDPEEFVTERALYALTKLADNKLLSPMKARDTVRHVAPLLCHPNAWLRYAVVGLISACGKNVTRAEAVSLLMPELKDYQASTCQDLRELSLLETLNAPLSRHLYNQAANYMQKRKFTRDITRSQSSTSSQFDNGMHSAEAVSKVIDHLRHLKLSSADEKKLIGLHRFIVKDMMPEKSKSELLGLAVDGEMVSLKTLGALPHTEFISPASQGSSKRRPTGVWKIKPPIGPPPPFVVSPVKAPIATSSNSISIAPRIGTSNNILERRLSATSLESATPSSSSLGNATSITGTSASSRPGMGGPQTPTHTAAPTLQRRISTLRLIASATAVDGSAVKTSTSSISIVASPSIQVKADAATSTVKATARADFGKRRRNNDRKDLAPVNERGELTVASVPLKKLAKVVDDIQPPVVVSELNGPAKVLMTQKNFSHEHLSGYLQSVLMLQQREHFPEKSLDLGPRVVHSRQHNVVRASDWRPEGGLISHLAEHTAAVTGLSVSSDHSMFASSSQDGTVKIWDSLRLDKNVSNRSKATFSTSYGSIKCMQWCHSSKAIAFGCDNGTIQVFRLDDEKTSAATRGVKTTALLTRGMRDEREYPILMDHVFCGDRNPLVAYVTNHNRVTCIDLRSNQAAFEFTFPFQYGHVSAMAASLGQPWMCFGTSLGILAVFDTRFLRPLRVFRHPGHGRIHCMTQSWEKDEQIFCAVGQHYVALWDIQTASCTRYFTTTPSISEVPSSRPDPAPSVSDLMRERAPSKVGVTSGVRGMTHPDGMQCLITGGVDRKLRFWDLNEPVRSFVVSGVEPRYQPTYGVAQKGNTVIQYETPCPTSPRGDFLSYATSSSRHPTEGHFYHTTSTTNELNPLHHVDTIRSVEVLDIGFPVIVSAGGDGVIKVWK